MLGEMLVTGNMSVGSAAAFTIQHCFTGFTVLVTGSTSVCSAAAPPFSIAPPASLQCPCTQDAIRRVASA